MWVGGGRDPLAAPPLIQFPQRALWSLCHPQTAPKSRSGLSEQESECVFPPTHAEIVDQPGVDIFGQVYNQWKNKECVCPNCSRSIAASRFAPHLEKCLGMGRNSSRIANRRWGRLGKLRHGGLSLSLPGCLTCGLWALLSPNVGLVSGLPQFVVGCPSLGPLLEVFLLLPSSLSLLRK